MTAAIASGPGPAPARRGVALVVAGVILGLAVVAFAPSFEGAQAPLPGERAVAASTLYSPPLTEKPNPRVVAVSENRQFEVRTVFPDRPRPGEALRANLQLVVARTGEVLWEADTREYPVRNFGPGAWIGRRVALPSGRFTDSSGSEDTISVVDFRGRRPPTVVAFWRFRPYLSVPTSIVDVRFESPTVVTATWVPEVPDLEPVDVRCTVGRATCETVG